MSITINSNLASTNASINLKRASSRLSKSIQRLSSGNRIISASDDAGGLAVAMKLQSSLQSICFNDEHPEWCVIPSDARQCFEDCR